MNTRFLLFAATVAVSVIGSTVALADETVYPSSPLTCAQASGEPAQPIAAHPSQRTDDAAGVARRAKAGTAAHNDS